MDFVKMEGLGNDFIVIEDLEEKIQLSSEDIIKLCDRHFGIGADGLMIVRPSEVYSIKMIFFNQDGTEAAMCGNGVRCFAKFVYERGIVKQSEFDIETTSGKISPKITKEMIQINMGEPDFNPDNIPVLIEEGFMVDKKVQIEGRDIILSSVLVGVPHTIIEVDNLEGYPVEKIGPLIEKHPIFPNKTNVNFVEILSRNEIKMLTWERGAGFTLACGTGASAVVSLLHKKKKVVNEVLVNLPGGQLKINIVNGHIYMIGKANEVFSGHINL